MAWQAVEDLSSVQDAVKRWAVAFTAGAQQVSGREAGMFAHSGREVWGLFQPWTVTNGKFYNVFGTDPTSFENKIVQVIPAYAPLGRTLPAGLIAKDEQGKVWVLHDGRLSIGPRRVSSADFRRLSSKSPDVKVKLSSGQVRDYYRVACLDEPFAIVQEQTASYVHTCRAVRDKAEAGVAGAKWTAAELEAAVDAYMAMWRLEGRNTPYVKAAYRKRALAGDLNGRSPTAFEKRMQNISWILQQDGIRWIKGYKPLGNLGDAEEPLRDLLAVAMSLPESSPSQDLETVLLPPSGGGSPELPPVGDPTPPLVSGASKRFKRDKDVVRFVLRRAKGLCEGCQTHAPFQDVNGLPFLEVHHVRPLCEGGPDTADNAVALCPNCHRRLHFACDRRSFRVQVLARPDLIDYPVKRVEGVITVGQD